MSETETGRPPSPYDNPWDPALFGPLRLRCTLRWRGRQVVLRVTYAVARRVEA